MFVIKIGGSLLFKENGDINAERIKEYSDVIKEAQNVSAIVCGGGMIARKYIKTSKIIPMSESYKDLLGIMVSRINARLFIAALAEYSYPKPVTNLQEALISKAMKKLIIAGGFIPGQSTTTVTLEIAEIINSNEIIILTDVNGIYNKNPKKYPNAKLFEHLSISKLEEIILQEGGEKQSAAGEYRIFDALSIQIFKRNNMKIRLINGNNYNNLREILQKGIDKCQIGTLITK
ncbi:MAG: UMP kinase [Promethearchaeota archaeon]